MRKRILSLFLALTLLCGLLPQLGLTAHAETHSGYCGAEGDGSNLTWSLDPDNGLLTIEGSGAMADYDWDCIPWDNYCAKITAVDLPEGLTSIGGSAFFACGSLTSVTIPDSVTSIGYEAFLSCTSLTSVTIPDSVTSIGSSAFCDCSSLTSVMIPNSVTSISGYVFDCCSALTSVTIPDSVTSIGDGAFYGCSALTSVTIPDSVTSIGSKAFGWYYKNGYKRVEGFTIYGAAGSAAEQYANENGFAFLSSDEYPGDSTFPITQNKLNVSSISPNHSSVGADTKFTLKFNQEVDFGKGYIEIRNKDDNTIVGQFIVGLAYDLATIDGKTVTVDISLLNLPDGSYSATISKRAFKTKNGVYYCGLLSPNAWEFEVCSYLDEDGIMEYATKGALWWKKTDTTKPGIPNGTDSQYAQVLYQWAQSIGIRGITEQDIRSVLAKPMYLPVTDMNGATVLLNDRQTTVKQALEDILFFESLQPFANTVDDDLDQIEKYTQLSGANVNPIRQETDLYEKVLAWYPQINKYLNRRSDCSPFFASAAPLAYQGLLTYFDQTGGSVYSYTKPILKANLDKSLLNGSYAGLQEYAEYHDYKEAVDDIGSVVKAAQAANKAVYTAFTENGLNTAKVAVKFGTGLLKRFFSDSDNSVLRAISTGWDDYDSAMSAGKLCAFLGCSIGAFPLVIDLFNKLDSREAHMAAAFYFISDYYVQKKYPELYNLVYSGNGFPRDDFFQDIDAVVTLEATANSDSILYNWSTYFTKTISEGTNRNRCRQLRFDLVNYIMLLQYAKEFNASEAKDALVKYISAECNQKKTTELYTSCPVVVEVYEKETDQLIATLSSEDEEIASCMYGTLYLLGENNETKCFVLNDDAYYARILPYGDGTMDVAVVSTTADGTREGKTFCNIALTNGSGFDLDLENSDTGLESETGAVIEKDDIVKANGIEIAGKNELPVGETTELNAKILPVIATNQNVFWSSSDETIARINEAGVVSAISEGEVTITASSEDGVSNKISFSVYTAAQSLSVNKNSISMVEGESIAIQATVSPDATHNVSWTTNNMNVATVSETGVITARTSGEAIIFASVDGLSEEIQVTVYDDQLEIDLYQIDLDENAVQIVFTNHSCTDCVSEEGYLAMYESGRLIDLKKMAIDLSQDSNSVEKIVLPEFESDLTYSAAFYPLGERIASMRELVFVNGSYEPFETTFAAAAELPACRKNEIEFLEAEPGKVYTLYVLTDESCAPTEDNIAFMSRQTAKTDVLSFTACPHEDSYGEKCYALILDESDQIVLTTTILSHNVLAEIVSPTCTESGTKCCHCEACGETYYGVLPALDHDWDAWAESTAPTCVQKGEETRNCSRCEAKETRETAALGHDWDEPSYVWSDDNGSVTATRSCKRDASHVETETVTTSYQVTREATTEAEGEGVYTATFTNEAFTTQTRTVSIPKLVQNPFVDVKESDFYFNPVLWAVENNVTSGTDPTHFSPSATVKRSEAMLFFYAAKGRPKFTTTKSPFKDVKKKHWFYDAVLWAVENKITSGTDATHFSPNKTCIRSEILQFLYAAMDKPEYTIENPYSDVKKKHWYYDGAIWAYEMGLERGSNGKFKAKTPCTRAYVVTYLYRFITGKELVK